MFAAALIVFRETLEAALFVGIVAAATQQVVGRWRWLSAGVGAGVLGALTLAAMADLISGWADGLGQDRVNVGILSVALAMLAWHSIGASQHGREMAQQARALGRAVDSGRQAPLALMAAVALAVLREGAETVLFVAGTVTGADTSALAVVAGTLIGMSGGAALGALIYLGLSRVPPQRLFAVTHAMVLVLAAALAGQLARALVQAGLVDWGGTPLWDTSGWLAMQSLPGLVMHALVGYDAQPLGLQLLFYVTALAGIGWMARVSRRTLAPVASAGRSRR
jgi:high-affinity iron transporter